MPNAEIDSAFRDKLASAMDEAGGVTNVPGIDAPLDQDQSLPAEPDVANGASGSAPAPDNGSGVVAANGGGSVANQLPATSAAHIRPPAAPQAATGAPAANTGAQPWWASDPTASMLVASGQIDPAKYATPDHFRWALAQQLNEQQQWQDMIAFVRQNPDRITRGLELLRQHESQAAAAANEPPPPPEPVYPKVDWRDEYAGINYNKETGRYEFADGRPATEADVQTAKNVMETTTQRIRQLSTDPEGFLQPLMSRQQELTERALKGYNVYVQQAINQAVSGALAQRDEQFTLHQMWSDISTREGFYGADGNLNSRGVFYVQTLQGLKNNGMLDAKVATGVAKVLTDSAFGPYTGQQSQPAANRPGVQHGVNPAAMRQPRMAAPSTLPAIEERGEPKDFRDLMMQKVTEAGIPDDFDMRNARIHAA